MLIITVNLPISSGSRQRAIKIQTARLLAMLTAPDQTIHREFWMILDFRFWIFDSILKMKKHLTFIADYSCFSGNCG